MICEQISKYRPEDGERQGVDIEIAWQVREAELQVAYGVIWKVVFGELLKRVRVVVVGVREEAQVGRRRCPGHCDGLRMSRRCEFESVGVCSQIRTASGRLIRRLADLAGKESNTFELPPKEN